MTSADHTRVSAIHPDPATLAYMALCRNHCRRTKVVGWARREPS